MRNSASSSRIINSPDFSASERQLALLRLRPALQPPRARLEKHSLPDLQLMRRHLTLSGHGVQGLSAEEPHHQVGLS
jgi:hypothetical protein